MEYLTKAEKEAYDKIRMEPKFQGVVAYGVLYRCFTDVSGLVLAERALILMRPAPTQREEELAEHMEKWAHGDEVKLALAYQN